MPESKLLLLLPMKSLQIPSIPTRQKLACCLSYSGPDFVSPLGKLAVLCHYWSMNFPGDQLEQGRQEHQSGITRGQSFMTTKLQVHLQGFIMA
ncbi:hypothetical protein EYC80_003748 [Monilinia laxa]|uniref:Uncharacterized protein n=1 Tax=Monilinia laxa TaxID=61186 RepID=A0A5N6KL02_MONLA|nr:hypothetical protein EYC80_003748 [Monilinia laxa]